MRVAVACDHGGFILKNTVIEAIKMSGNEPVDIGIFEKEKVDYPDYALKLANAILEGKAERGVLLCSSGVGVSIAANKIPGIYAATCHDAYSAHQGVEHDNMNVLCLGGGIIGPEVAKELVISFLGAVFYNNGNYLRRFDKIKELERSSSTG